MEKLKLNLDDLMVESFHTTNDAKNAQGTVEGYHFDTIVPISNKNECWVSELFTACDQHCKTVHIRECIVAVSQDQMICKTINDPRCLVANPIEWTPQTCGISALKHCC